MEDEAAIGAGEAVADLLDAIYAAATDLSRWEEIAARTTRGFGGPCSIYLRPDAAPDATQLLASALDPDFRRSHDDDYARKNLWIIRDRGGESAIRNGDDVVEGEDLERSEYFGDWLEPQGLRHGVTCGVRAMRSGNLNYAVLYGGRRTARQDRSIGLRRQGGDRIVTAWTAAIPGASAAHRRLGPSA